MAAGLIVAGGRSTRFGDADKAVAELAGVPMLRRVADRLSPAIEALVVNCRPDQRRAVREALDGYDLPVTFAEDEVTDRGPLAGIHTGLRAVDSRYAAVVSCDMPFVDPAFVKYLFGRVGHGGEYASHDADRSSRTEESAPSYDAAVPRGEDGWYQTIQAVYRTRAMVDACEAALSRGDRRTLAPLDDLDYLTVDETEIREHAAPDTFANLNTREEFDRAAGRIRAAERF